MNDSTILLRQVHPSFVQDGRVTSQAFRPTPKDDKQLSVYHGDMISASGSWEHFVAQPGCNSAGVMGASHQECISQSLPVVADGVPFPEHASINFAAFEENDIKKKAKVLAREAQSRGWLHQKLPD
jgi:hypothetical protein